MTMSVVQIITAYANLDAATAMSVDASGTAQCAFVPATTSLTGYAPAPDYCWCNGWLDDSIIALYVADPSKYTVTWFPNRQAFQALAAYSPPLAQYLGTAP